MAIKVKLKQDIIDRRCQFCGHIFSKRYNLLKHIRKQHTQLETSQNEPQNEPQTNKSISIDTDLKTIILSLNKTIVELKENIEELKENQIIGNQQLEQLKDKPNITNNVLQVVCIAQNDNYLDMLTEEFKDFNKSLAYIKNCALSNINGDCQLIEKIYLNKLKPSFYYQDKAKTKIEYFNENKVKSIDKKQQFCNKLANNLQNSYLKGINHVITENLDNHRCPNKFLEEYDIQTWNQHIYNLSDLSYQKKLINQLNIPCKTED